MFCEKLNIESGSLGFRRGATSISCERPDKSESYTIVELQTSMMFEFEAHHQARSPPNEEYSLVASLSIWECCLECFFRKFGFSFFSGTLHNEFTNQDSLISILSLRTKQSHHDVPIPIRIQICDFTELSITIILCEKKEGRCANESTRLA